METYFYIKFYRVWICNNSSVCLVSLALSLRHFSASLTCRLDFLLDNTLYRKKDLFLTPAMSTINVFFFQFRTSNLNPLLFNAINKSLDSQSQLFLVSWNLQAEQSIPMQCWAWVCMGPQSVSVIIHGWESLHWLSVAIVHECQMDFFPCHHLSLGCLPLIVC